MNHASSSPARRIESIDTLRGLVMILMALDHVRDYFGAADQTDRPRHDDRPLFFTRWITHCAPTPFLLTGTGAYLSLRSRGKTACAIPRYRGAWLIVLETVIMRCLAGSSTSTFASTASGALGAGLVDDRSRVVRTLVAYHRGHLRPDADRRTQPLRIPAAFGRAAPSG
jgi:hypothetical protein